MNMFIKDMTLEFQDVYNQLYQALNLLSEIRRY